MAQNALEQQWYEQAVVALQQAWAEQQTGNYEQAIALYEQAHALLQGLKQFDGYRTARQLYYLLAQCCIHSGEIKWLHRDLTCAQTLQYGLKYLYQALQLSPNNPGYMQEIRKVQSWLSGPEFSPSSPSPARSGSMYGFEEAKREAKILRIMERMRRDPQWNRGNEEICQALAKSGRLLEFLSPGSVDPTEEEQLNTAFEAEIRQAAEDEYNRQELRQRIVAEGSSPTQFDATLYALDQMHQEETRRWQGEKHEQAEATSQRADEKWQRQLIRTQNERLGLLHLKPCSCWSCRQGYT